MTRTDKEATPSRGEASTSEAKRVDAIFSRYAESRRKQSAWAADNPGNVAIRRELIEQIERACGPLLSTGDVLDIGCGSGWCLRALANRGANPDRLNGVDLLEPRINEGRRRLPGARLNVADAGCLPYPDRSFDIVLMLTLLSSLSDRSAVADSLSEARRVLRPGGVLLCWEPRVPNPFNRHALFVSSRTLSHSLGDDFDEVTLTVLPPLSRRLGSLTDRAYPILRRISPLRTHRLSVHRAPVLTKQDQEARL